MAVISALCRLRQGEHMAIGIKLRVQITLSVKICNLCSSHKVLTSRLVKFEFDSHVSLQEQMSQTTDEFPVRLKR